MLVPVHVDSVWPQIAPIAAQLLIDPDEPDADALYRACQRGEVQCLQSDDALLIVRVMINPTTSQRELVLRWGNSVSDELGAFERQMPDFLKVAQDLACQRLRFYSVRTGWIRKAIKMGWRVRNIEFVRDVSAPLPVPSQ